MNTGESFRTNDETSIEISADVTIVFIRIFVIYLRMLSVTETM
jgi:hypothetical protein